jgi:predicted transcriptional regulator
MPCAGSAIVSRSEDRDDARGGTAPSIAGLARALGRDYKRVHADVEALSAAGLIDRTQAGLRADYDEIRTRIAV